MSFYFLDSPEHLTKEQVGGKGYYLHQMAQDNLPIPEASFLSTDLWKEYRANPKATTEKLKKEIIPQIVSYFKEHNGGNMPLVSVRSAGAVSMPGMMDTILNVGVNQKYFKDLLAGAKPAKGKSKKKADKGDDPEAFAANIYARFLTMYGQTVLGMKKEGFPAHDKFSTIADVQVAFEELYAQRKQPFPSQKPEEQLLACVLAVFDSWDNDRAKLYRKLNNINNDAGTAVVIQKMVFGNRNDLSATGVLFSRDPSNGKNVLTGEYLVAAQGEDVVSGSHTPKNISEMREEFPDAFEQLQQISDRLEQKYKQVQDIEFTIEDDKVYILQARTAKCAPYAKLKMLMDMYKSQEISAQDVLDNLSRKEYLELNVKQVDASARRADGQGLPASMGAMVGRVVFGPSTKYKGEPTIFLAQETTPDDLEAIQLATGILTASGGVTSHAAVVARGMGKVCVVGCKDVKIKKSNNGDISATIDGKEVKSGDWVTLDANEGKVWVGNDVNIIDAQNTQIFWDLEDLVLDANPEWTRITSKVDEVVKGKQTYFLTYDLDDKDETFVEDELRDALRYLTGILDLTGKLDFLQEKYNNQFLFTDSSAEKTFLLKKRIIGRLVFEMNMEDLADIEVHLGKYEKEYGDDFKRMGLRVRPSSDISTSASSKASLIVSQQYDTKIPANRMAISSKNALLGVLK